ncbi:MAG TPA: heme biosynthesis HemY N-terminal domain-containing protein [Stenotrophomonas sp.]|nr:heme biosynthesis HemY N-terminal domain-containing protein [Stenotrophomonas sp.]
MKPLRSILILLVAVVLGVVAAQWLSHQQRYDLGEVVVRVGGNDYIAPMPQAVLALIVALLVLWLLWIVLTLPFRAWGRYRRQRGRARLIEGMRAYELGQWNRAGKALVAAGEDEDVAPVALPLAIRVADARADADSARVLSQELATRDPVAHALLQAERMLAAARPVDAINALDAPAAQPLPPRGLVLRTEALALIGRASEAYGQLGALRQQQALAPDALAALERRLATLSLEQAGDANALAERWESLPKALRSEPTVVAAYVRRAAALHWDDAALRSLDQALDASWDEELVVLYGELPLEKYDSRRASAQRWLASHPSSPGLLLTLARLARHQQQWAQAEEFLHRAIAQGAGAPAWEELGEVFAATGEPALATQCYRNALHSSRGAPVLELAGRRDLRERIHDQAVIEDRDEHGTPRLRG